MSTPVPIRLRSAAAPAARGLVGRLTFTGLLLSALAALAVLVAFSRRSGGYGVDWLTFFSAAERWRDGGKVYTVAAGFFNPPPTLLPLRLAIALPYDVSCVLWGILSQIMLLASAVVTARAFDWTPSLKEQVLGAWWILASAPALLLVPVTGNLSAPVLLSLACALALFRHDHEVLAGAVLAGTLVKPQLAMLAVLLLLYKRRRRAVAGLALAVAGAGAVTLPFTGLKVFADYAGVQRSVAGWSSNNDALQLDVPGIHGMLLQRWPHVPAAEWAADAAMLLVVLALALYWRGPWLPRSRRFAIGWAQVILATLLVTSFAHSYDLVLLIVPAVALYATHLRPGRAGGELRRWLLPVLVAVYVAPYLVLLYRHHFLVPVMLAAFALLWRVAAAAEDG